jgi:hypothetical protein
LNRREFNLLIALVASSLLFLDRRKVGDSGMKKEKMRAKTGTTGATAAMIFQRKNIPMV